MAEGKRRSGGPQPASGERPGGNDDAHTAAVGIGIIGCGQRLRKLCSHLLGHGSLYLAAIYDPDPAQASRFLEACGAVEGALPPAAQPLRANPSEVIADQAVAWVMIGSPNAFHYRQAEEAIRQGKQLFLEKPLAVSVEECLALERLRRESGRRIVTGFVLRYSPLYRRMHELLASGGFGPVLTIQASENISYEHAAYITRGWRRRREIAGPHVLEKCIHDLDLMQWMGGSRFSRIAAAGGRAIFTPENAGLYSPAILESWAGKGNLDNPDPFAEGEVSIEDRLQLQGELESGVPVQFSAVAGTAIPERRMTVHCLRGSLIGELYSESLRYRRLGMEREEHHTWSGGGLHGGGDPVLAAQLHATITAGAAPPVDLTEGLWANIVALEAERARLSGEWVALRPIWRALDEKGSG
jgi:predicted dehydrogenase